jgi:glyoxylase-like metal-dependent hydrolase (beta-lactamase superfamily II)
LKLVAEDVWQLTGFPPHGINEYLVGDVLVDAGARFSRSQIMRDLRGRTLSAHVLTHAHADHQGASAAVCERFGVPLWVGEADADAAERPELIRERQPDAAINHAFFRMFAGPGRPVDRRLREGDEVGQFRVLDTPGHSRGHIALWRESDRTLIAGDVLNSQHPLFGFPRGLRLPLDVFTPDRDENRRSAKRLGELEPRLVLLGHGPPVRDPAAFAAFCLAL